MKAWIFRNENKTWAVCVHVEPPVGMVAREGVTYVYNTTDGMWPSSFLLNLVVFPGRFRDSDSKDLPLEEVAAFIDRIRPASMPVPWQMLDYLNGARIDSRGHVQLEPEFSIDRRFALDRSTHRLQAELSTHELCDGWLSGSWAILTMADGRIFYAGDSVRLNGPRHASKAVALTAALRGLLGGMAAWDCGDKVLSKAWGITALDMAGGVDAPDGWRTLVGWRRGLLKEDAPAPAPAPVPKAGMARCAHCGKLFQPIRKSARFCRSSCRTKSFLEAAKRGQDGDRDTVVHVQLPVLLADVVMAGIGSASWTVAPGGFVLTLSGGPKSFKVEISHPGHPLARVEARAVASRLRGQVADAFELMRRRMDEAGDGRLRELARLASIHLASSGKEGGE